LGSRYTAAAWQQISVEFAYLVIVLFSAIFLLAWIGYHIAPPSLLDKRPIPLFGLNFVYPRDRKFLLWLPVGRPSRSNGFIIRWPRLFGIATEFFGG
jgi:hypothetical protein